ncbi:hypothetical protein [Paludisphaera soli]|uniref:hypothetical protein n=1 Tax=Paludisphaera soli TaxID=2712865 RepID=UPI0013ED09F4|nr:hypothetical protein [Paludisphaera soli]
MIGLNHSSTRARLVASSLGVIAVALAGAATLEANRPRFLVKSAAERQDLREALRRYDMRLNLDEQRAARGLDDRLNSLPDSDRDEYLTVLRRYHNWLHLLPERVRNEILNQPVDARLAKIREAAAKYPPPDGESRSPLDFMQIGGTGAFELASLCKVWLSLSPADRQRVDALPAGDRKGELIRRGRELKIPRELKPDDFEEARWAAEVETRIRELREASAGPRDWIGKIESKFEQAGPNIPEVPQRPRPFMHRLAVNLYVQEHVPAHPVDSTRLAQFFAATPPWIQSTFGAFPSDEVRRRLSVIYRILFPFPEEYRPTASTAKAAAPPRKAPPGGPSASPPSGPTTPKATVQPPF